MGATIKTDIYKASLISEQVDVDEMLEAFEEGRTYKVDQCRGYVHIDGFTTSDLGEELLDREDITLDEAIELVDHLYELFPYLDDERNRIALNERPENLYDQQRLEIALELAQTRSLEELEAIRSVNRIVNLFQ